MMKSKNQVFGSHKNHSSIKSTGAVDQVMSKGVNPVTSKLLANDAYQSTPTMQKVIKYGSVDPAGNTFNYTRGLIGGKKRGPKPKPKNKKK